jgi:hypothetical protein
MDCHLMETWLDCTRLVRLARPIGVSLLAPESFNWAEVQPMCEGGWLDEVQCCREKSCACKFMHCSVVHLFVALAVPQNPKPKPQTYVHN